MSEKVLWMLVTLILGMLGLGATALLSDNEAEVDEVENPSEEVDLPNEMITDTLDQEGTILIGDEKDEIFNINRSFVGEINGGSGDDSFIHTLALYKEIDEPALTQIDGGAGNDNFILNPSAANIALQLTGGEGADSYGFTTGEHDEPSKHDKSVAPVTILDFDSAEDLIGFAVGDVESYEVDIVQNIAADRTEISVSYLDDNGAEQQLTVFLEGLSEIGIEDIAILDLNQDIEAAEAGDNRSFVKGTIGDDTIDAGPGSIVETGAGNDVITSLDDGIRISHVNTGTGNDTIEAKGGLHLIDAGAGDDLITLTSGDSAPSTEPFLTNYDDDRIEGYRIKGSFGDDTIVAIEGNDSLQIDGGSGDDEIQIAMGHSAKNGFITLEVKPEHLERSPAHIQPSGGFDAGVNTDLESAILTINIDDSIEGEIKIRNNFFSKGGFYNIAEIFIGEIHIARVSIGLFPSEYPDGLTLDNPFLKINRT